MDDRRAALIEKINSEIYLQQARNVAANEKAKKWPSMKKHLEAYAKRYPDRILARHALRDALKCKRIVRPDVCSVADGTCSGPIQAHHWHGYDADHCLDVQWLCRKHHREI